MSCEVKNYLTGEVEEELYAGSSTIPANTTSPLKVDSSSIPAGFEGVAVAVAATQNAASAFFFKLGNKQYYNNGLNTAGLAGLTDETPLLVKMEEKAEWEIGFTNTSGAPITQAWRFRIRKFKIKK